MPSIEVTAARGMGAVTGTNRPEPSVERKGSSDWRVALIVVAACVAVVAILRIVAAGGESAGQSTVATIPTPVVSASEGCANFARYWMEKSGVGVSAETIEGMSNCRRAADGTWFVPNGPRDPRLGDLPSLTDEEQAATADLRSELLAEIAALEATFPPALRRALDQIRDPSARAVRGHLREDWQTPVGPARGRYTRLVQAYLMAPERQRLADYVGWLMARRLSAFEEFQAACLGRADLAYLHNACSGVENALSVRYPPFPWELKDPLNLDAYLLAVARQLANS